MNYLDSMTAAIPTKAPISIREDLLQEALNITTGNRNKSYGDPLANFNAIVALKRAFWHAMADSKAEGAEAQNTVWGHSMDMVLGNIGRIASAPSWDAALARDRYVDSPAYLAIALEVAMRTRETFPE